MKKKEDKDNGVQSFTFYRDYYNLINTLPVEDKTLLAISILDYVFEDKNPTLTGHNKAVFNTLSYQLNYSKNQSKRRRKNDIPEENQKETEKKPKENPKGTKQSISSFLFLISSFNIINNNNILKNKIIEWLEYKKQKKKNYTEIGLNTLLKKIEEQSQKYGIEKVIALIDDSMANNYQGIIWEKLENQKVQKDNTEEIARKNKEARERVLGVFDE